MFIVAIAAIWFFTSGRPSEPGEFDAFAQCLTDKGAMFYGAFWCSHCERQREMFGNSVDLVNYIECSTPDGRGQRQPCIDKNIESYPTWDFADGSRVTGTQSMQALSVKTGCTL